MSVSRMVEAAPGSGRHAVVAERIVDPSQPHRRVQAHRDRRAQRSGVGWPRTRISDMRKRTSRALCPSMRWRSHPGRNVRTSKKGSAPGLVVGHRPLAGIVEPGVPVGAAGHRVVQLLRREVALLRLGLALALHRLHLVLEDALRL